MFRVWGRAQNLMGSSWAHTTLITAEVFWGLSHPGTVCAILFTDKSDRRTNGCKTHILGGYGSQSAFVVSEICNSFELFAVCILIHGWMDGARADVSFDKRFVLRVNTDLLWLYWRYTETRDWMASGPQPFFFVSRTIWEKYMLLKHFFFDRFLNCQF